MRTRVPDRTIQLVPPHLWTKQKSGTALQARGLPSGWYICWRRNGIRRGWDTRDATLAEVLAVVGPENRERVRNIHKELIESEEWRIERAQQRVEERRAEARRQRWKV